MLPRSLLSPSQYIVFDPLVREFNVLLLVFLRIKKIFFGNSKDSKSGNILLAHPVHKIMYLRSKEAQTIVWKIGCSRKKHVIINFSHYNFAQKIIVFNNFISSKFVRM